MTTLSIIALQAEVAALGASVIAIEGSVAAIDVEIGSLQSQTFFVSSNSTPFGIPTEVNMQLAYRRHRQTFNFHKILLLCRSHSLPTSTGSVGVSDSNA